MSDLNYTIAHQWAEARQLLNDAGMSHLTLPAAVAALLSAPVDAPDPTGDAIFWERLRAGAGR